MQLVSTPDHCFDDLEDYPFSPNYVSIDDQEGGTLKLHYVDEGPKHGQAVVMIRLLIEDPTCAAQLVQQWAGEATCQACLEAWQVTKAFVMDTFNTTRQQWIKEDLAGWVAEHGIYETAQGAFRILEAERPHQNYIITTKSAEFVAVILQSWGLDTFASERIFGLGSGPKINTIRRIVDEHVQGNNGLSSSSSSTSTNSEDVPQLVPVRAHFFEDKLSTLVKSAASELSANIDIRFYFARWGYNTEAQLIAWKNSNSDPRITVHATQVGCISFGCHLFCSYFLFACLSHASFCGYR